VLLVDLGLSPQLFEPFRASGRFFWPVAYALLICTFAVLARHPRRTAGAMLVLALGALQFLDAAPLRAELQRWATAREPWTMPVTTLRQLFKEYDRLTLVPTWSCASGPEQERLMELLTLASERPIPVNTMYLARWRHLPPCEDAAILAQPPAPGELRLFLPEAWARHRAPQTGTARCTAVGSLIACGEPS